MKPNEEVSKETDSEKEIDDKEMANQ